MYHKSWTISKPYFICRQFNWNSPISTFFESKKIPVFITVLPKMFPFTRTDATGVPVVTGFQFDLQMVAIKPTMSRFPW